MRFEITGYYVDREGGCKHRGQALFSLPLEASLKIHLRFLS
jgi:hypothetical protein